MDVTFLLSFSTAASTIKACTFTHTPGLSTGDYINDALCFCSFPNDNFREGILSNSGKSDSTRFSSLAPRIPEAHPNRYFPFVFSIILQGSGADPQYVCSVNTRDRKNDYG